MRAFVLAFAFASALALTSAARADVVDMPPTDCPAGSRGFTCHGGVGCAPVNCMLDSDCGTGEVCGLRSLCVGSIDCYWSGTQSIVTGPCESSPCDVGTTCVNTRYCLPAGPPVDAATLLDATLPDEDAAAPPEPTDGGDGRMLTRGGCACRAGAGRAGGGRASTLVAVAVMTWLARTRRAERVRRRDARSRC